MINGDVRWETVSLFDVCVTQCEMLMRRFIPSLEGFPLLTCAIGARSLKHLQPDRDLLV